MAHSKWPARRFVTINELGDEVIEDHPLLGHVGATNNEMELLACIRALQIAADHKKLHAVERVVIFTDSLCVSENVDRAKFQWSRQKCLNSYGRPIENATLWTDLVRDIKKLPKRVDIECSFFQKIRISFSLSRRLRGFSDPPAERGRRTGLPRAFPE